MMLKLLEVKSINPKVQQSAIAKELRCSSSTLNRYRNDIKMLPPYRKSPSSNTHTRKQKFSNHTAHDLKMTSNDLKMSSREANDKFVSEK